MKSKARAFSAAYFMVVLSSPLFVSCFLSVHNITNKLGTAEVLSAVPIIYSFAALLFVALVVVAANARVHHKAVEVAFNNSLDVALATANYAYVVARELV